MQMSNQFSKDPLIIPPLRIKVPLNDDIRQHTSTAIGQDRQQVILDVQDLRMGVDGYVLVPRCGHFRVGAVRPVGVYLAKGLCHAFEKENKNEFNQK